MRRSVVAGIFVGGQSQRMGGRPKGLLVAPSGETIVERWRRLFEALGVASVLVGAHDAYASVAIPAIADEPSGIGPLGGLVALLTRAQGEGAIAVACDMPYVSQALVGKLALHPSPADVLAPRHGRIWEPLFARYRGALPLEKAKERARRGDYSLQGLLEDLAAEPLPLLDDEMRELRDWDSPEDQHR
jgi:molybdopterin-guanine dinucleotide biosynthesis protein A